METKPARPYLPINGNGELQPDAERRTPNPRHRHRRPQKRTLTTKNGREKTVRFLFHYLQLFFTFSIPPNPPSSHFFPFISSFLYIYLIGFHFDDCEVFFRQQRLMADNGHARHVVELFVNQVFHHVGNEMVD